jgi:outer membrane receptor for ferrienterochelin and colicins
MKTDGVAGIFWGRNCRNSVPAGGPWTTRRSHRLRPEYPPSLQAGPCAGHDGKRPRATRRGVCIVACGAVLASGHPAVAQPAEPTAPVEIGDGEVIVITDARRERPLAETTVATEVITREQIEQSGAETLAELLADHPGIEVAGSLRGSAIRMQGLDADYVLVLVDGQRAIGRINGAINADQFPVEDIERIEIVKGASSALYGSDALAGVVHIITRKADRPMEAELHSSYGRFNTLDLSGRVGGRHGAWNTRTSAGWHRSDGYDLDPATVGTSASAYDDLHIAHRTSYGPMANLELVLRADYQRRDQHGVDASSTGAVFDRTTRTETASTSLAARWQPARSATISASGHYSLWLDQFLLDQRASAALDRYETAREQLGEAKLQYDAAITGRHFLSVGGEGLAEFLESDRLAGDGARYRIALFGQHEWTIVGLPAVVVAPGLRMDLDSQFGQHVSPKLAARWDVHHDWIVRASYGAGFRAPGFRELLLRFENPNVGYLIEGNPALEPESSRSANAGVEARIHRRATAAVNLFHNDIDNLIAVDLLDEPSADGIERFGYVNIASARTRGLELQAKIEARQALAVELGYTLTDTLDRQSGTVLPGRALHRGTVRATYRIPSARLALYLGGSLYGRRTFFDGDLATEADPYVSIDGRLQMDVTSYLTLFSGVDNALNEGDPQLLPIAPRTFYGGATARYR